jgi:hypothetical protein
VSYGIDKLSLNLVLLGVNRISMVNRMTDKRMKVSLRIAFAMSRFSNVKALYRVLLSK